MSGEEAKPQRTWQRGILAPWHLGQKVMFAAEGSFFSGGSDTNIVLSPRFRDGPSTFLLF